MYSLKHNVMFVSDEHQFKVYACDRIKRDILKHLRILHCFVVCCCLSTVFCCLCGLISFRAIDLPQHKHRCWASESVSECICTTRRCVQSDQSKTANSEHVVMWARTSDVFDEQLFSFENCIEATYYRISLE